MSVQYTDVLQPLLITRKTDRLDYLTHLIWPAHVKITAIIVITSNSLDDSLFGSCAP